MRADQSFQQNLVYPIYEYFSLIIRRSTKFLLAFRIICSQYFHGEF